MSKKTHDRLDIRCPPSLVRLFEIVPRSYLVGGCVRDALLGHDPKDFDIEVYGMHYHDLNGLLEELGEIDLVGKAFGVIKLTTEDGTFDVSLARRDSVGTGVGHKNFNVETPLDLTIEEGCARRDLTVNSLAYDPRSCEVIDPFGGLRDLSDGVLRHTSHQFREDPLRVLRVMQFSARFDFGVAPETVELCKAIKSDYASLPTERIHEEWFKGLTKCKRPSKMLKFLEESEWISHFPELGAMIGCQQDAQDWHPEGDAWVHTGHCCDALAQDPDWKSLGENDRYVHMLGVLCHDLGKPLTTRMEFKPKLGRETWVSPGHDKAGEEPTKRFLARIGAPNDVRSKVIPLVVYHMAHLQIKSDSQIRQLAVDMHPNSIEGLGLVTRADHSGRPPLPAGQPEAMQKILDRSKELGCRNAPPAPILKGRHIAQWSVLEPGKRYGILCKHAYKAQIKGQFNDEAGAQAWFEGNALKVLENAQMGIGRLINGVKLASLFERPCRELGDLHKDLAAQQLKGSLRTEEDAWKFINQNHSKYGIPEQNLTDGITSAQPEVDGP